MAARLKALLKGLRYISQKLDNEKEPDIVIGLPTDVKHVAHIGWDGPSVDSPSWMNEFKPPSANGEGRDSRESASEEVSKPAKRQSVTSTSTSGIDSPTKIKTDKHRSSRRASSKTSSVGKDVLEATSDTSARSSVDSEVDGESPRKNKQQPDNAPRRSTTRKKKPRDGTGPPRSSSRLSAPNAASNSPTGDNNNKKDTMSEVASLRDKEMFQERRGEGKNGTVS